MIFSLWQDIKNPDSLFHLYNSRFDNGEGRDLCGAISEKMSYPIYESEVLSKENICEDCKRVYMLMVLGE